MRGAILRFVDRLRAHDVSVSVGETMDAVAAVAAAGVERSVLRDALATTLVRDERDRPVFDRLFDETFPLIGARAARPGRRRGGAGAADGVPSPGRGGSGTGHGQPRSRPEEPPPPSSS